MRWPELKEFFSQWGEVEYTSVALDRETKRSRWFGFVTFVNAEDAARAKEEANEQELQGRPIYIDFAKAREDKPEEEIETAEETEENTETEEISSDGKDTTEDVEESPENTEEEKEE